MFDSFNSWMSLSFDAARMAINAQSVIGLRMLKVAAGGKQAEIEMERMVSEKSQAFVEAQLAMARAMMSGESHLAPNRMLHAYSRRVNANHRRLSRG